MTPDEIQLANDIGGFTHNPLGHALYTYPWNEEDSDLEDISGPRKWQAETLEHIGSCLKKDPHTPIQIAIASGHGIGKSSLCSMLVKWGVDTCEDTKIVVTANTESQLRLKTWSELQKWHDLSITKDWFKYSSMSLASTQKDHDKKWRADAIANSEHNSEGFAGLHNVGKRIIIIFDEASAIPKAIWEVVEGALSDANTEIIWICFGNPTRNSGNFFDCFTRQKHRWWTKQIDSRTVEGTNPEQAQKLVDDFGEDSDIVRVRVRGLFPRAGANQMLPSNLVTAAMGRTIPEASYNYMTKVCSVDPAWEGKDCTVITIRHGWVVYPQRVISGQDPMAVASIVNQMEAEHRFDGIFVDAIGIGAGVIARLNQLGHDHAFKVKASYEAHDKQKYFNSRVEMYGHLKDWLDSDLACLPDDPQLDLELTSQEVAHTVKEQLKLEPKADLKKRIGVSPDKADSLAIGFAFPVEKRNPHDRFEQERGLIEGGEMQAYDIFS